MFRLKKKLPKILNNKSIGDRRGQVAIFVALIFQVLFLFFAMIVNVGLLVHHKINLQNSVDLAAYYGAMKQAEVMNAMGHINYQIRQGYKLMTWRYRVLGTAGVMPNPSDSGPSPLGTRNIHPVDKQPDPTSPSGIRGTVLPGADFEGVPWQGEAPPRTVRTDYYQAPAFCVAFKPFAEVPAGENTCRAPTGQSVAGLLRPPTIAGFLGTTGQYQNIVDVANQRMADQCKTVGPLNYINLARSVVAFNVDQGSRKRAIFKLARGLSDKTDDFIDLEGESGKEGIEKTLLNNLTEANKESFKSSDLKIYSGLGGGDCGTLRGSNSAAPRWISEIFIFPRSSYKICSASNADGTGMTFEAKNIDEKPVVALPRPGVQQMVDSLNNFLYPTDSGAIYRTTVGVEKNPWCMAYVGVKAETEPDIPFSLGKIKLKAVAFAKPFGGRIGPWYGRTWDQQAFESTGVRPGEKVDPRLPLRCPNGSLGECTTTDPDAATTINYSRFPGDQAGLMSRRVAAQFAKAIFGMSILSVNDWDKIELLPANRNLEWDTLSWRADQQADGQMRKLEIAAITPDLFDITNYSIDPDFYGNYIKDRMEKLIQKNPSDIPVVPYDLGSRKEGTFNRRPGTKPLIEFNITDQIKTAASLSSPGTYGYGINFDPPTGLLHQIFRSDFTDKKPFENVLTAWAPPLDRETFNFDETRLGKCPQEREDSEAPVPGSCINGGGRSGYSVKLISSDYLYDRHDLGKVSEQVILNPPPADFVQ